MITTKNIIQLLNILNYVEENNEWVKIFHKNTENEFTVKVDVINKKFIYPDNMIIHRATTTNFSKHENFVVFEIVNQLFTIGYMPHNIELEMSVKIGRGSESITGWADVLIKDNSGKYFAIVEAKTDGEEYENAWKKTQTEEGYQIFSYVDQLRQVGNIPYGVLYSSTIQNDTLLRSYRIFDFNDKKEFLEKEKDDPELKLYKNTSNAKELFDVWVETYDKTTSTFGMFEERLTPFNISVQRPTVEDIYNKPLNTAGLIHTFRSILRKYNVAGGENAFDRLLNLLLAKIVDEKQSKQSGKNLDFYWRGIAYDEKKALVDRLQRLYRDGMRDYLREDVTYIDKNDVDNAFVLFKNDKDATRNLIQHYFDKLKFYTDNFFAFIDVYNEKLFEKNFEILSSIVELFQDVSITNSQQHQFLGDLFEKLLDQGVKQSEGQYFTPLPIVKFIVNSLPIIEIINTGEVPKVIDYASGSGHFLTEYANQINNLEIDEANKLKCLEQIYGIEKESRLAKVSKVSALMYGAGDMQIFFQDALKPNENILENTYDILMANPPYSVAGFLETLTTEDKQKYKLTNFVSDSQKARGIQNFFIERAVQLLKPGGIAAIILPISVLRKGDRLETQTRKIIFENFEIVAIFESGNGTFGKTGTPTDTLFLRKRDTNLNMLEHFIARVESWAKQDFSKDVIFEDVELLTEFSERINVDIDEILSTEKLKERLVYYLLVKYQHSKVVIVQSPSDSNLEKKFLGYTWSDRRGFEGIIYLNEELDQIDTPLYNPKAVDDSTKINTIIRNSFLKKEIYPENEYVKYKKLEDLISWHTKEFNLTIDINRQITRTPDLSKGERLISLADSSLFELKIGKRIVNTQLKKDGPIPVYSANVRTPFGYIDEEIIDDYSTPYIIWGIDGDWQVGFKEKGEKFYPTDHLGYIKVLDKSISPSFLVPLIEEQGKLMGLSRNNRASIKKMKQIELIIPPYQEQIKKLKERKKKT